ncbi:unnamed protein product [Brassicogethes aeneus]|uniref:RIIa domain-containing protein n=1 Tax=Brassicogethes aeneus TaxID=1431903 RepID=A0A9P0B215_BRAAE|nr:unnamed protein product [Brassicogethes aeneus]
MDVTLQRHCAKFIYVIPDGLKELISDISREVLRSQPEDIYMFVADYLDALLITRENARVAIRLVNTITEIAITTLELLTKTGIDYDEAEKIVTIMNTVFKRYMGVDLDKSPPIMQSEDIEDANVVTAVFTLATIPDDVAEEAAHIIQNAFRKFKARREIEKKILQGMVDWRIAARSAIYLYRKTGVTKEEADRAATLIKPQIKDSHISANDFCDISFQFNWSNDQTCNVTSAFRKRSGNRHIISSFIDKTLMDRSHQVDSFFDVKEITFINFKKEKETNVTKTVVYCSDVIGFLNFIKEKRNISETHKSLSKRWRYFFKNMLCTEVKSQSKSQSKRPRMVHGSNIKDTGVNKLFILALAANVQENHSNIFVLWTLLKIEKCYDTIAADLKLLNILLGIGPHSSMYPCLWCTANQHELDKISALRTFENCKTNDLEWYKAGSNKKDAKEYFSCINPAIVSGSEEHDILTLPELHLMLGVVNHIVSHMIKECNEDALKWVKACNVQLDKRHGGASFNGNACRNLLKKKTDNL